MADLGLPATLLPQRPLVLVGMDPSMSNWGIARGILHPSGQLEIANIDVIQPSVSDHKQVRQNSKDVSQAEQLFAGAMLHTTSASAIFAEVPVGSQSARAMASYGICVGVLASLQCSGRSFLQVSPTEVKLASAGSKTATKLEMIQWAVRQHPEANWPKYTRAGVTYISESKAEHMADAIAAIYAGVKTPMFQQLLRVMSPLAV